ncbi:MAG: carbon-nitrogen hydrolase [Candidatus Tectomicrobia bacterium]|nr:carbon-nitrogen hydrolase [Candidatus Tectomicrobia bacterium]
MKLRVGLAQITPALGRLDRNLELCLEALAKARQEQVDLLLFPELSLTGYYLKDLVPTVAQRRDSPLLRRLADESRDLSFVVGLVEESPEHLYYNACCYFEEGALRHVHRKVYLPTYGIFDEHRYLARGDRVRTFDTKFGRLAMLLCEDLWHPSAAYLAWVGGARMILAPSSSPGRGVGDPERLGISSTWEAINRFYAKMFSLFVCFANRVGYEDGINFWGGSEVVGPDGGTVVKAEYLQDDFAVAAIDTAEVRRLRFFNTLLRDEDLALTLRELQRLAGERYA